MNDRMHDSCCVKLHRFMDCNFCEDCCNAVL